MHETPHTHLKFYPQCRFPSWTFNEDLWIWEPANPRPPEEVDENGCLTLQWLWDEATLTWVELRSPNGCADCEVEEEKIDQ